MRFGIRYCDTGRPADPAKAVELIRAAEAGRDPDALEIATSLPARLDDVEALARLGARRILVLVNPMPGMVNAVSTPERFAPWPDNIERFASL